MVEAAQLRRNPLAGIASPGRSGLPDGPPGVIATVLDDVTILEITALPGRGVAVTDVLASILGVPVTDAPRVLDARGHRLVGKGPGRWWLLGDRQSDGELAADLRSAFDSSALVLDQRDSRLVIRMTGPRLRETLAKGVPVDLDPTVFGRGSVASTLVAYVPMTLIAIDDAPTFDLLAPRSLAGSAWHWLSGSAAPYGCELRIG